jgi:glycopeptide antibiotics resistance protein
MNEPIAPLRPWRRVLDAASGASLILEIAQCALAVGSSDVTDGAVNTAGAMAGFVLFVVPAVGSRQRQRR